MTRLMCIFGVHRYGKAISFEFANHPNGATDTEKKIATFQCVCGDTVYGLMIRVCSGASDNWLAVGRPWRQPST